MSKSHIIQKALKVFSDYLRKKIPSYSNKDLTSLLVSAQSCGGLFTAPGAILGMVPRSAGLWEILFLAAETKEGRKSVFRDAIKKHNPKKVFYTRSKHNNKVYVRGSEYWERLLT